MIDKEKVNMLSKWNYEKHIYEPYKIPASWNVALIGLTLETKVNCCECGKTIKFYDSYASMKVHNHIGLGYVVCEKCYEKEWQERRKYRDD